ncbi:hypothetical protein [Nocardia brasiliensis]|uniref:hypothetical protein n=1 Tax=Nocardia brasiliensis TaxID=37326 RepID=UPI00245749A9|nr:hypothetical protein [Nocardia brasiliensis]
MTAPVPDAMRDRLLLAAAKSVLDCREFMQPPLNEYLATTGHDHPLASAMADLRTAVAQYEGTWP